MALARGLRSGRSVSIVVKGSTAPCCSRSGGRAGRREFPRGYSRRVAATPRLQRGYSEGRYLGRPETDVVRCTTMVALGDALRVNGRPEEALTVFEARAALVRRFWPHNEGGILVTQSNIANCLGQLGRHDAALTLERKIYAKRVAMFGTSHQGTILAGTNQAITLSKLALFDEAKHSIRDQLLPVARQSLGADNYLTLGLEHNLAMCLRSHPECTRDHLRGSTPIRGAIRFSIPTQATTYSRPRQSCRRWSRSDGGSSAPRIQTRFALRALSLRCAARSPHA